MEGCRPSRCYWCGGSAVYEVTRSDGRVKLGCREHLHTNQPYSAVRKVA